MSPTTFSRRFFIAALGLSLLLSGLSILPAQAIVPNEVRTDVPIVLDGRVLAVTQIGNRVIVGGDFQQVRTRAGGPVIDQPYLFAYNVDTGEFDQNFRPVLNGQVRDIENDPNGRHIYFAGKFKKVDGLNRGRVARYDVRDAKIDKRFRGRANAKVESIAVLGDGLVLGGNFTKIATQEREYLALVDRRSGKPQAEFDHDFGIPIGGRYYTNNAGDRVRPPGVHRVAVRPGTSEVLVAHKHDSVSGQASIGLAMFDGNGALLPWRTDVYTPTTCVGNWGIAITDISWSPDGTHFAVGHTGHDTGIVCDALVKFSVAQTTPGNEVRQPIWSSRVFDSIFSVEWASDTIYLGGHFRYLVHPSAPSTYPGRNSAYNRASVADVGFNNDLVIPGYVFVANQIGAIDPNSGKGVPTWLPTSNAFKGILTMTMTDRGLLIGQDNGQVNDRTVGRSALFDPTPTAGHINCTVTLNAAGQPTVSWSNISDPGEPYRIKRNGKFLARVAGTSYTDRGTAGGETAAYTVSYRRYNEAVKNHPCGTTTSSSTATTNLARQSSVNQSSTLGNGFAPRSVDGNLGTASTTTNTANPWLKMDLGSQAAISAISLWNGGPTPLQDVSVFVSTSRFTTHDVNTLRQDPNVTELRANSIDRNKRFGNEVFGRYVRVHIPSGVLAISELEVLGTERAILECQAVPIDATTVRVTWNDIGAGRYAVASGGVATSVARATSRDFSLGLATGTHQFEVRAFSKGVRVDTTTCSATLAVPDIGCTAAVVNGKPVLQWDDVAWSSVSIARNGSYLTTATGATSWTDTDTLTGNQTYELRVRANGVKYVGQCGGVTLP